MDFEIGYPQLERQLDAARDTAALDAALDAIIELNGTIIAPEVYGRKLFCAELDRIIPRVAARLPLKSEAPPRSNDNVCIVATRFYITGGHTGVANDIVRDLPAGQKPTVILTQLYDKPATYESLLSYPNMQTRPGERGLLLVSARTAHGRILELHMLLRALRPTRIVLLCHPFDIISMIATYPFREIVDFVHVADHVPSLGATMAFGRHVDVTYTCHQACRAHGLPAVYASLTSSHPQSAVRTSREPGKLRLATCGLTRKFQIPSNDQRWTDYAVAALKIPGAELHHIGELTPDFENEVRSALQSAGIDQNRYIITGVKPLVQELVARNIDVYISSYPVPGGKANLEAIAAGVPVVLPVDDATAPLLRWTLPLPYYVEVSTPAELGGAIEKALGIGDHMLGPQFRKDCDREVGRFADFLAGRPLAAVEEPAPIS